MRPWTETGCRQRWSPDALVALEVMSFEDCSRLQNRKRVVVGYAQVVPLVGGADGAPLALALVVVMNDAVTWDCGWLKVVKSQ